MVDSAKMIEARRIQNEAVARNDRIVAERKKKERIKREVEEKMRSTGIIDLFEEIRNKGIVKYDDTPLYGEKKSYNFFGKETIDRVKVASYRPAEVSFDGMKATIIFDYFKGCMSHKYSVVEAYFDDEILVIEGADKIIVGEKLNMVEAVGMAIVNPKIVKHNDQDDNQAYNWD